MKKSPDTIHILIDVDMTDTSKTVIITDWSCPEHCVCRINRWKDISNISFYFHFKDKEKKLEYTVESYLYIKWI